MHHHPTRRWSRQRRHPHHTTWWCLKEAGPLVCRAAAPTRPRTALPLRRVVHRVSVATCRQQVVIAVASLLRTSTTSLAMRLPAAQSHPHSLTLTSTLCKSSERPLSPPFQLLHTSRPQGRAAGRRMREFRFLIKNIYMISAGRCRQKCDALCSRMTLSAEEPICSLCVLKVDRSLHQAASHRFTWVILVSGRQWMCW